MLSEEITEFGKLIVQKVRDNAIRSCDAQLKAINLNSPIAKRWHDAKAIGDIDLFAKMIISDAIDDALFNFFNAIDQELISLSLNSLNGKSINLLTEGLGELSGWYIGEWRMKYSKERCFDDLI